MQRVKNDSGDSDGRAVQPHRRTVKATPITTPRRPVPIGAIHKNYSALSAELVNVGQSSGLVSPGFARTRSCDFDVG